MYPSIKACAVPAVRALYLFLVTDRLLLKQMTWAILCGARSWTCCDSFSYSLKQWLYLHSTQPHLTRAAASCLHKDLPLLVKCHSFYKESLEGNLQQPPWHIEKYMTRY